jgi:integrase
MRKHHPENERTKRRYFEYLKHARQLQDTTIDQAAAAIADFEASTSYRDFRKFRIEQAQRYKRHLAERTNAATGKPLSKPTISSRLMALKSFFQWLAGQPGFRSKLTYADADYFRPSANDERIAKAVREKPVPSIEQIRYVLASMQSDTDIQMRDRALIAFTLLSGARDNAVASMSLKHVDLGRRTVFQDARDVRTKNRKTFTSWFFPVGDDIESIVIEWIEWLKTEKLFGPDDPLFPATKVALGIDGFEQSGLDRKHWKSAAAIRKIFRQAFEAAGLHYFNPHSFRSTLARYGSVNCPTNEAWSAWCENLGHEDAITTFRSYANVPSHRRAEIFEQLRAQRDMSGMPSEMQGLDDETMLALLAARLRSTVA